MERIFHTWDKWECYPAGFYAGKPPNGVSVEEGEEVYREFLSDLDRFGEALEYITTNWVNSCEHYLSNANMNRIAWLGQAAAAQATGMPSCCRGGYNRLSEDGKKRADDLALVYLNKWLVNNGGQSLSKEESESKTEMNLY